MNQNQSKENLPCKNSETIFAPFRIMSKAAEETLNRGQSVAHQGFFSIGTTQAGAQYPYIPSSIYEPRLYPHIPSSICEPRVLFMHLAHYKQRCDYTIQSTKTKPTQGGILYIIDGINHRWSVRPTRSITIYFPKAYTSISKGNSKND